MSRSLSPWSWAAAAAATLLIGMTALTAQPLPQDMGAAGAWQKIKKLRTTASLLHTTAHPDDEHGGMLALVSRGDGARTTLLTLNRGEAGDNAIGPELFDALGLIRTEELRVAGRYYGLDEQYFSTAADYGFSKRVDEALEKWGREAVLADMVRVIRLERPLVIVSRFQGTARDGHGQHQAAGLLTQEAFKAAADPKRFPEQIADGLRPWQALKLYIGGARADEAWTVEIDPGRYEPALGESYQTFARLGLSFQRSQNGGRFVPQRGSTPAYYTRVASLVDAPAKETSFFDGIDTSYAALPRMLRRTAMVGTDGRTGERAATDASLDAALAPIDRAVSEAVTAFSLSTPAAAAPALAHGLQATRAALLKASGDPDLAQFLRVKERQFQEAINAALGVDLAGIALPAGTKEPEGPWATFGPQPTMGPVVAAQTFAVRASFTVRSAAPITLRGVELQAPIGWVVKAANPGLPSKPQENRPVVQRFEVITGAEAAVTRPAFTRASIAETHYTIATPADRHRPSTPPPVAVRVQYEIEGVTVEAIEPVKRREDQAPYGYALRDLDVLPAVTLTMTPDRIILPTAGAGTGGTARKVLELSVDVTNNKALPVQGGLALAAPKDWRVEPATQPFTLEPGERTRLSFKVTTTAIKSGLFSVSATAAVGDKRYREGYEAIAHRDLDTRYQYRTATTTVSAIDVAIAPNLRVGYVMGIGDELPAALTQLGAAVTLLDERALARGTLTGFDAIVLGTRAYAVRPDLRTHNRRLLDYARQGGNLIVLYNTSEFDPAVHAPFPAKLTPDAEEVSEEDAAVTMLVPQDPVFLRPNRITAKDFDGWIEQRGSKFWSEWDNAYTALLECHDRDQPAQRGGWLHARVGKGHYSYVAYAFHRQLPYGVPGAYRLMANLLSQGNQ